MANNPICANCVHFDYIPMDGKPEDAKGECTDSTKRIYAKPGRIAHSPPHVEGGWTCRNFKPEQPPVPGRRNIQIGVY